MTTLPGNHLFNYPKSIVELEGTRYWLAHDDKNNRFLGLLGNTQGFVSDSIGPDAQVYCQLTAANASALRSRLAWLNPVPLGLKISMGLGDRLGLATPGHIAAMEETGVSPIFAQQSVRENARTGRSPGQVLDDAMWGVFQEGWRLPWGADADHLKTFSDTEPFISAGYSFYTVDPGDHVTPVNNMSDSMLASLYQDLPWKELEIRPGILEKTYLKTHRVDDMALEFSQPQLFQAAVKYGKAISHIASMYRQLCAHTHGRSFDFEVSVDETETPTSPHEHFYIASELKRLGIQWVSLAPRFVGRFEKGVDYIGDLKVFEKEFVSHAAIVRHFGNYKISIHSGSDKFSVYPIVARYTQNKLHVKTAGTSYLEALRVIARLDSRLFREILTFSRNHYETDRASYHVSASLDKTPSQENLKDDQLPLLLDQFDAREVLHVTYGSVLASFGTPLKKCLVDHPDAYAQVLNKHIRKHLEKFLIQ